MPNTPPPGEDRPHPTGATLVDQVFTSLTHRILDGEVPPGGCLPSERALCDELEVNRQVVREAIKRLEQLGLVHCAQGDGNRVLNWAEHGRFDLLPLLASRAMANLGADRGRQGTAVGEADLLLVRSLIELRRCLAGDAARLCATRADDDLVADLRTAVDDLAAAGPAATRLHHEWHLWSLVFIGAGNLAYRFLFNTVAAASGPASALMSSVARTPPGATDDYRRLVGHIADGHPGGAETVARRLVGSWDVPR